MISISILNIKDDKDKIIEMDKLGAEYIHIDIMDNEFVPNKSDMLDIPNLNTKKDVHLMVYDIKKYIDEYIKLNPDSITFHIEATDKVDEYIEYIKSLGVKVGLAINPETNPVLLLPYINRIDLIIIMSVHPGFGGQKFIEDVSNKIDVLDKLRKENNYKFKIEVDGGINNETKELCKCADRLVVGSYITKADDYKDRFNNMK